MAAIIGPTAKRLRDLAERHETALVAYSGGKDSLVVMDLAVKFFRRVEALFMAYAPGLAIHSERLEFARKRWGVVVREYAEPSFIDDLRLGQYCDPCHTKDEWASFSPFDIYRLALEETGCQIVLDGMRKQDSHRRRKMIEQKRLAAHHITPIADWNTFEVKAYLAIHKIPEPAVPAGVRSFNVGMKERDILFMHDHHPEDFRRLAGWFPYCPAVVWKRHWYDNGPEPAAESIRSIHIDGGREVAT